MPEELTALVPAPKPLIQVQGHVPGEQLPPAEALSSLTPDQVHAREAVFTQQAQDQKSHDAAALLFMWSSTLLLHDLAAEHLSPPADEEVEEEEPRPDAEV